MIGVPDRPPQHLVSAADANDGHACPRQLHDLRSQALGAEPIEVGNRTLGTRQDDGIGSAQGSNGRHVPHPHARLGRQRIKVVKVRDQRQLDDGNVNVSGTRALEQRLVERHCVLFGDAEVLNVRDDAQHGDAATLMEDLHAIRKE